MPPGNVTGDPVHFFASHARNYPQAQFDLFPYCGIQRPVMLYITPNTFLRDVSVETDIQGADGRVHMRVDCEGNDFDKVRFRLAQREYDASSEIPGPNRTAEVDINVPNAAFWSPSNPNLYNLTVELLHNSEVIDSYSLKIGIRTIRIMGNQLLLNGKPIYLIGFGRHEDFPIVGRGYLPALIVKDYALMHWMDATSFRTSHYPYSEQMLDLADQLGFLVIDETPAVELYFREDGLEKRNALCQQYVQEMIACDKNHPSVIMWSVANEPHSISPFACPFFEKLYQQARVLDSTRPVTLVSFLGEGEEAFEIYDLICLNRYLGW